MAEGKEELNKTINELGGFVIRRRWWLLLTTCGGALATILISLLLPNYYSSEATMLVERQQVPERYVTSTSTADYLSTVLEAMTQDVLSRTCLLQIIEQYGLYPKERKRLTPEELVAMMRSNVEITPLEKDRARKDVYVFSVAFTSDDPRLAQGVVGRLTSLFIEENLKTLERQATGTTSLLQDQLQAAQAKLEQQEQRLRDFKMRNLGELPEQQQGNVEILARLHIQLQNTMAELSRAQEQRVYLGSLIAQYHSFAAAGGPPLGNSGVTTIDTVQSQLNQLRNERASLLARYTPEHPDLQKIDEEIGQSEALLEKLTKDSKTVEGSIGQSPPVYSSSGDKNGTVAQLNSQLEANRVEIANASADQERLEGQIAQYERRLNLTPVREQQLSDILRDYNQSKQNYTELLSKKTESELATNLERRQQGRQFRVVDPPSLPAKPSSPDRVRISLVGTILSLFLAAGLAYLAEVRDCSFHGQKEVSKHFSLPVVVGVPLLLTPAEERKRSRRRALEWVVGPSLLLAVLAAEFFVYWRG